MTIDHSPASVSALLVPDQPPAIDWSAPEWAEELARVIPLPIGTSVTEADGEEDEELRAGLDLTQQQLDEGYGAGVIVEPTPEEISKACEEICGFQSGEMAPGAYVLVEWTMDDGRPSYRDWQPYDYVIRYRLVETPSA